MKPLDFIKKYNLGNGWVTKKQDKFLEDITKEFKSALEYFKVNLPGTSEYNRDGENVKGFQNAVDQIKQKWTGISNKVKFGLPDSLWNYFYATVVSPLRDEYLPKEMERRAEKQRRWEERNEQ